MGCSQGGLLGIATHSHSMWFLGTGARVLRWWTAWSAGWRCKDVVEVAVALRLCVLAAMEAAVRHLESSRAGQWAAHDSSSRVHM